mgnify:CR=1 FL=1
MPQLSFIRVSIILVISSLALFFASPNFFYSTVEERNNKFNTEKSWLDLLPSSLVKLGLDLKGGVYMLLEIETESVIREKFDFLWIDIRDSLIKLRNEVGSIKRLDKSGEILKIKIGNPKNMSIAIEELEQFNSSQELFSSRWSGTVSRKSLVFSNSEDTISIEFSIDQKKYIRKQIIDQSLEIIRRRVDEAGTREPSIQKQGIDRILVQVPGLNSSEELIRLLGKTAKLTFHEVIERTTDPTRKTRIGEILVKEEGTDSAFYVLKKRYVVSGETLTNAQPSFDENGMPAINFNFNPTGAIKFGNYTRDNIGSLFAIVLDNVVLSAPVIRAHIAGGSGIISGNFSVEESNRLAILLRSGALPAEIKVLELRTIGPELGIDSINSGKFAAIIGGCLVLVFMWLSYGLFGIFANIALVINILLVISLISVIGATLTLPGIAGIVLTIGMAVDANVLIFERIKEELKLNKSIYNAINTGYEKAMSSIVDANVTTMIAAIILFFLGSGPIKGFSVTLGIGILTSVFTALFLTRIFIDLYVVNRKPNNLKV